MVGHDPSTVTVSTQPHRKPLATPPSTTAAPVMTALRNATFLERAKRFILRIDVCGTFFYFIFLVCIAVITTAITQTCISGVLLGNLHNVHQNRMTISMRRLDLAVERIFDMAAGLLSLYINHAMVIRSESTLSKLCSILAEYDISMTCRSLSVTSLELKEAASCIHGDANLGSRDQLYGWMTQHSNVDGPFLVDDATSVYQLPLVKVYGGWPESARNITPLLERLWSTTTLFEDAAAYYNGSIHTLDYSRMWRSFPELPHIIYCNVPAGFLLKGLNLTDNFNVTDYVDVRIDGSNTLTRSGTAMATGAATAVLINASLTDADPLIMSNNWGQPSVNDSEILLPSAEAPVAYLRTSNVSDPLMRAALRHLDLAALQREHCNHTVVFQYDGAPAIATAIVYTTSKGLTLPMVFASSHAAIAARYTLIMHVCSGVTAAAVVLLTALFWLFVHRQLHYPLRRIATLLLLSMRRGTRLLYRDPPDVCVALTELCALADAHNAAMRQLREVDAFIPEAARKEMQAKELHPLPSVLSHRTESASSLEGSAGPHSKHLMTHLSSVVYLTVKPAAARHGNGAEALDVAAADAAVPQRHRLASVVENAARTAGAANSGPFPSPAVLGVFLTKVLDLSVKCRGTVLRLCPDSGIIHFNQAVRAHRMSATAPCAAKAVGTEGSTAAAEGGQNQEDLIKLEESRCAKQDVRDALNFALSLQAWVDAYGVAVAAAPSHMPDVRVLVDTGRFTCGQYRPRGCEQTVSVALGRDVQRELGHVPFAIGVRVAMTEETASRVRCDTAACRDGVRQLPVEALQTGRRGLDADVVVLYEALPGAVDGDAVWSRYERCCFRGFGCMVRGDYAAALRAFGAVAEISDLEPGLLPRRLSREAAASNVVGGAVSTQVARLMRECERRVRTCRIVFFPRLRMCPLGIDAVLRGKVRRSAWLEGEKSRSAHCEEEGSELAKREGRYGVEPNSFLLTRTASRYVGIHPGTDVRISYTGRAKAITDNWGTSWRVADKSGEVHDSYNVGLSGAGLLCALCFELYRQVPAMVAKVLCNEPEGVMSDAMRSAVPVWLPLAEQRADVHRLLAPRLRLSHPNILSYLGYSLELEGGAVVVTEFSKGGSLREVMARYAFIPTPTLCRFAVSILLGLRYLHQHGMVHGELRPDCVLTSASGLCQLEGFFTDYALAHRVWSMRRTSYVCPEVAAGGQPTPASDVFGVGLIMLELIIRDLPWTWAPVAGAEGAIARSADELRRLAADGGQPFSDAVAQGRVAPATDELSTPSARSIHPEGGLQVVYECLRLDPALRPSVDKALELCESIAVELSIGATPLPSAHCHTDSPSSS